METTPIAASDGVRRVALAIDDNRSILQMVRRALEPIDMTVTTATSAEDGLAMIARAAPDVVLLDYILPEMTGLEALTQIRASHPHLPVIFMTGRGSSDTAIEATVGGVDAYLQKPLDLDSVAKCVQKSLDSRSQKDCKGEICPCDHGDSIVGRSTQMQQLLTAIGRVAARDIPVLVRGESGTGKELVAEALVRHSDRASKRFLAVNCAALSDTLLESELFGHERGAFTGAEKRQSGKFEQCDGGTLFLDEVGDMSIIAQSKVLRVLQEQAFERVGGQDTITTDVRIIAATNRDLEQMCAKGTFRADLLHRLNGYTIVVPPLRERNGDIRLLLEHFLSRFNRRLKKNAQSISPAAASLLSEYSWPGNVRELQMVLSKAMLDSTSPIIGLEVLAPGLQNSESRVAGPAEKPAEPSPLIREAVQGQTFDLPRLIDQFRDDETETLHGDVIAAVERFLISRILEDCDGNRTRTAKALGITRSSLRHKLGSLGISIDKSIRVDAV